MTPLRRSALIFLVLAALTNTGCATVEPRQREILSDPIMVFDDDPIEKGRMDRHHDYREGSTGGTGVHGGGCGCG